MPQSQIDSLQQSVEYYAKNPTMRSMVTDMFKLLIEHNRFNYEANIYTRDIEPIDVDIGNLEFATDYELDAMYKLSDGTEIAVEDFDDKHEEAKEALEEAEQEVAEQEDIITEIEDHPTMPIAEKTAELAAARAELARLEKIKAEKDDLCDMFRASDRDGPQTNECMWNTVWIYDKFDKSAAAEAGLGTGLFCGSNEHSGENFVHLFGCGMNLQPHICAYEALVYGAVAPGNVRQFKDVSYFSNVVGDELAAKVFKILNIGDCLETMVAEQKQRMADFDAACAKAVSLRKSFTESGDPALGQLAAMMTLAKHL